MYLTCVTCYLHVLSFRSLINNLLKWNIVLGKCSTWVTDDRFRTKNYSAWTSYQNVGRLRHCYRQPGFWSDFLHESAVLLIIIVNICGGANNEIWFPGFSIKREIEKNSFNIFHMLAESADPMIILSG